MWFPRIPPVRIRIAQTGQSVWDLHHMRSIRKARRSLRVMKNAPRRSVGKREPVTKRPAPQRNKVSVQMTVPIKE
jgi:hypothetical protein